jgi:hypothetical protein
MDGILISELPKTFRDAIDITRSLELRYLWIDSLCILQDSESDWATHVEVMASIYENAHITLAAGASDSDEGGFFVTPSNMYTEPHIVVLNYEGVTHTIYVRRAIIHPDARFPAKEDVLPLMDRGWYVVHLCKSFVEHLLNTMLT